MQPFSWTKINYHYGQCSNSLLRGANISNDAANGQHLKEMCQEAGVLLEFLPPYSLDFNSIEEAFAELKA